MKRLGIVLVAILLLVTGCQTAAEVKEAPDDLMTTPAGWMYRANVHEAGVTNPWPPVESVSVDLGDNISVNYRSYIETNAGETRNNIVDMLLPSDIDSVPGINPNINLSTSNITTGIEIKNGDAWTKPGEVKAVLIADISKNVKPGEYTFDISVVIGGKDYGKLPCTINVTK